MKKKTKRGPGRPQVSQPGTPLGRQLRLLRGDRTLAEAASLIGRSDETWRRWEIGEIVPSVAALVRIARQWRVSPVALIEAAAKGGA